jgi:hypothetical protein
MKAQTCLIPKADYTKTIGNRRLRARKDGMVAVTLNRAERRRLRLAGVTVTRETPAA